MIERDFIRVEKYEEMVHFFVKDRAGNILGMHGPRSQIERFCESNGYELLGIAEDDADL